MMSTKCIPPLPAVKTWTVVNDGRHNAFTDLLFWQEQFWLAYVSSPSHFASKKSQVVILRSENGKQWDQAAQFSGDGEDIRDPKLAIINGQLVLYALLNQRFDPEPYKTVTARSEDGMRWTPLRDALPEGWLLGRPVTPDDEIWFAPAHHLGLGTAVLFTSTTGVDWKLHSTIHAGDHADETALHLLSDGRMLAVTRLEAGGGVFGHPEAGTLISSSRASFTEWMPVGLSQVTRLDGPLLCSHGSQVFAIGRRQVNVAGPFHWQGSALARKRCAIFRVEEDTGELIHLMDLPSAGDTSYPGAAVVENNLLISYYTNDPGRDLPWLIGMFIPTKIQMAMIELSTLPILEKKK